MKQIVSWKDVFISICSEIPLDISKIAVPYYIYSDNSCVEASNELVIELSDKNEIKWNKEEKRMIFSIIKLNDDVYKAIPVLLNVLIKLELQQRGMFVLHASSVVVDDRAILLFGSSGSGKTATAMHLGISKKAAFLSNGSTVVSFDGDECKVIGTYKPGIKIRKSTLMQYDDELCNKLFESCIDCNDYDRKIVLSPKQMQMIDGQEKIADISNIELYIIQLDSQNREAKIKKEYDYKVAMQIYEDLIRELDCAEVCVCINNQLVYVPSLDDESIYKKRIQFINYLMENHFCGTLMGGLDEVSRTLLR